MSSKVKFQIRQATSEDALSIAFVHHNSRQLAYRSILDEELLNAQSLADRQNFWKEQTARLPLDDTEIYVAEAFEGFGSARGALGTPNVATEESDEGETGAAKAEIVGFIVLVKNFARSVENSFSEAEIDRIYVHPDAMGKGVGSALMNHCLDRLRATGCKNVCLWVFEANMTARRFYEAMGFSTDGNRRQIKPYPHDLIYTRSL